MVRRVLLNACCFTIATTGCGGQLSPAPDDTGPTMPSPDELAVISPMLELVGDDERLFWIGEDRSVRSLPKAGGSSETLSATADAAHLVVDGQDLVWSGQTFGELYAQPKKGGPGRSLTAAAAIAPASPIAASAGAIYALNRTRTAIVRVQKAGGDPVPVADVDPLLSLRALSADKDTILWADSRGLAWTPFKGAGTYIVLDSVASFAVDGISVLWAGAEKSIWRVPRAGGDKQSVTAVGFDHPAFAVDDRQIYWVDTKGLWRAPKGGGERTALWTGESSPRGLVADGSNVFWVARGAGGERVLRLRRTW